MRYWATFSVWGIIALASVTFGIHQSLHPAHNEDLWVMHGWVVRWFDEGRNVYADLHLQADYPPHAIVLLSVFLLSGEAWLPRLWAIAMVGLAPIVAYLAVRMARPLASWTSAAVAIAMFCAWGSVRISLWTGQITLPLLGAGLLSVAMARTRPILAGILCGLALIKPHIGAPFVLWALLTRQATVVAGAAAVVLAGLGVFALRASVGPAKVVADYWNTLTALFVGENRLVDPSAVSLRPVVHAVVAPSWLADAAHVMLMAALFVWLCRRVFAVRESLGRSFDIVLIAVLCAWSLLAFFNQPYNGMLLLPAMTWLLFGDGPRIRLRERAALGCLQVVLTLSLSWRFSDQFTLHALWRLLDFGIYQALLTNLVLDHSWRVIVPSVLALVMLRLRSVSRPEAPVLH